MLSITATASAQESANDFIEPRIDRQQFDAFVKNFALDRNQKNIAEMALSDYQAALTQLAQATDQAALDAGRQTVQDAFSGKNRLSPDELARLRVEVLKVYERMFPAIDQAHQQLIDTIEVLLTAEQQAHFPAALRALHRQIMLHPRLAGSQFEDYAGDGVDVLVLLDQARQSGGELNALDPRSIDAAAMDYEMQLDALLVQSAAGHRQGKLLSKIASIQKDQAAIAQQQQQAVERWRRLYQLNLATVQHIEAIARQEVGDESAARWRDRFDAACFEWMYPRRKPDRQIEWINKQADLTDKQREQAQQVYGDYVARRNELNRQAIELMLRARLEFRTMLYSMMDPTGLDDQIRRGLHEPLLKNSGEVANLESTTVAALEGVLNDSQRKAMREAMKGPDPARRRTSPR